MPSTPAPAFLFDHAGKALAVVDGVAIPADTKALLVAGKDGSTARWMLMDATGRVIGAQRAVISATGASGNSTATPLGAAGVFTGAWEEVLDYSSITILLKTDQPSAIDGLQFQYSSNGTDMDDSDVYTIPTGGASKFIGVPPEGRYFRVVYTNGATPQGTFRLQTIFRPFRLKPSSHNLREALSEENDAELVKAILAGKKPDGTFVNAIFDSQGRLVTSPPSASVATKGFISGQLTVGSTAFVVVRKTVYTEQSADAQRSLVSANANDTSAGTGVRKVKVTYFTGTMTGPFVEEVTMNGTTAVNTAASDICFIEKMEASEVGSGGVAAGIVSLKAATAGGGATIWSIAAGDTQTFGSQHYVATGKNCFITGQYASTSADPASFSIRAKDPTLAVKPDLFVADVVRIGVDDGSRGRDYGTPIELLGPTRITGVVSHAAASQTCFHSFDFYEE